MYIARCAQSRATLATSLERGRELESAHATRTVRRMNGGQPDHPSCSQNAQDETVLVRWAQ
jgi:hypothetical protein